MQTPDAVDLFPTLSQIEPLAAYNFDQFRTEHLVADALRTATNRGVLPGAMAPDFELPQADGGTLRLSDLRGRPVLLHFGSYTWPATTGSVEPLRKLHDRWGDRVRFVDVLIRQAHPGPAAGPYRSFAEKLRDAGRYRRDEAIPWPVVADDLAGTVHQVYGGLADPTYLVDADGRVAYYNMWTFAPNLDAAITALLEQGGRGVVAGGIDHVPHPWPAIADGWKGLSRALPQSYDDLERAAPGSAAAIELGHAVRPLLAPWALRAQRIVLGASPMAVVGAAALGLAVARAGRRSGRVGPTPS